MISSSNEVRFRVIDQFIHLTRKALDIHTQIPAEMTQSCSCIGLEARFTNARHVFENRCGLLLRAKTKRQHTGVRESPFCSVLNNLMMVFKAFRVMPRELQRRANLIAASCLINMLHRSLNCHKRSQKTNKGRPIVSRPFFQLKFHLFFFSPHLTIVGLIRNFISGPHRQQRRNYLRPSCRTRAPKPSCDTVPISTPVPFHSGFPPHNKRLTIGQFAQASQWVGGAA